VGNLSCADIAAQTNMSETKARDAVEALDAEGLATARETEFRLIPGRTAHSFAVRPLR
jgi:DNA-binding IclR family transcriptional regulator